jgi:hypothetical protein
MTPLAGSVMQPVKMRIVEDLDNGDKVITYFDVSQIDGKFYYVYNDVNHGPYHEFDDAVQAAYEDLIPQPVSE